jgi:hypothetical protein
MFRRNFCIMFEKIQCYQGRIQDFKLGRAHLKKLRRAEGGANIFGVFRVKNHDFSPKNILFNATFNNISVISWLWVLLVEETGVPGENHRPVASHWQALSYNVVHLTLIEIRTHNISELDLYFLIISILKGKI